MRTIANILYHSLTLLGHLLYWIIITSVWMMCIFLVLALFAYIWQHPMDFLFLIGEVCAFILAFFLVVWGVLYVYEWSSDRRAE